ncbi:hypothetical protein D9M71_461160 [compost metagenome]
MRGVARTVVHPGDLHDDQADAAFGAGLVVGDQAVVDQVVGGDRSVVAAGHDAVLQAFATDLQRFEQVREGRHAVQAPAGCCFYFSIEVYRQ